MKRTIPGGAAILLAFIYETETGLSQPACYDVIYGHNQDKLAKPLTSMTYGDVVDAQKGWSKRFGSSAAGAGQFMRATLVDLANAIPSLRGDQLFDADLQDQLAYKLLVRRGYDLFVSGKISRTEFGKRLAQEWASFPVLAPTQGDKRAVDRGQSFYAGDGMNKALVSAAKVEDVLDRVKALGGGFAVREKPVVADPGELERSPLKSKTVWQWIITTVLVPVLAVFQDWRVQLAVVVIVALFAAYAIKRRFDLAKAVRKLRAELE